MEEAAGEEEGLATVDGGDLAGVVVDEVVGRRSAGALENVAGVLGEGVELGGGRIGRRQSTWGQSEGGAEATASTPTTRGGGD